MRNVFCAAIFCGVFTTLAALAAEPAVNKDAVARQAKEIAKVVPASWEVRVDENTIWIVRKETAAMISTLVNSSAGGPPLYEQPTFMLKQVHAVTVEQVETLKKRNMDRDKALEMLRTQLTDLGRVMVDHYEAATPEQQGRLNAYDAVMKALPYQPEPTLFAEDAAFRWIDPGCYAAQETVHKEMDEVREKIEALFAKKPAK